MAFMIPPLDCAEPAPHSGRGGAGLGDTLRVAPPSGAKQVDRENVQAAFDSVRPGDVVMFDAGTYRMREGAYLKVPDVTVLGHPLGTVLRGCDPEAFEVQEAGFLSVEFGCTGFFVQAERQTVRNLTFEYAWHGIVVGPYSASAEEAAATQGMLPPLRFVGNRVTVSDPERVEGPAVTLEGNGNAVELSAATDSVRDLGGDNHVTGHSETDAESVR